MLDKYVKLIVNRYEAAFSTLTRVEVHNYNIRHIQHHAAQLILRLRFDGLEDSRGSVLVGKISTNRTQLFDSNRTFQLPSILVRNS